MTSTAQQNGLAARILEYIQQRRDEKLEKEKNAAKRLEITAKYEPSAWLSDAARRARQLSFITHAAKYIHGDSRGSSVEAVNTDSPTSDGYISTNSVPEVPYDVVGNAAALDVGKLLLLEHGGQKLIDALRRDDNAPLLAIAPDADTAQEWADGFLSVLASPEPSAHKFSKQCYWPVQSDEYHIHIPLYATSLAHAIHAVIQHARFSAEAKATREARRKEEDSEQEDVRYPNLAVQSFGGTKPQNISQLNSQRGGKAYLVSCEPPDWQRQTTPPLNITSIFSQRFERRLYREHIQPLRDFLQRVADRPNNDRIKKQRAQRLDTIVDEILNRAAFIQQLPPGWSADPDCRLPFEERCWLDPERAKTDEEFRSQRDATDWAAKVAQNFAIWLSHKLESGTLAFGAVEQRELRDLLEPELRGL
ncbi:MAG: type I-F CRISPR-associated protein Csy1 [Desulfurellaceae bacterium]|nr:type I-F CRISPR-associated protein Csy1 [Desulfurellaceae bacterium]